MKRIIIFVWIAVFLCPGALWASGTEENIRKIRNAYKTIRDLKGSFVQKNIIRSLNKTDTYKGEFFIKYPMKMKWSYKGKASQDVTIFNDTMLIFKKGDNQAYRGTFDKNTYGQTPVALLSGFGDIEEEFIATGSGNTLVLKPKKMMGTITSITLTLAGGDFPISSFTVYDGSLNVIEIELRAIQVNSGLKDSLFDLSIPKGVNVFEIGP